MTYVIHTKRPDAYTIPANEHLVKYLCSVFTISYNIVGYIPFSWRSQYISSTMETVDETVRTPAGTSVAMS